MTFLEFSDKGNPKLATELRKPGVGSDLSLEKRIGIFTQSLAELHLQVNEIVEKLSKK